MKSRGNDVWTKVTSAKQMYVTEASDLSMMEVECPECHAVVSDDVWRAERDNEGEVVSWVHLCACGTTMKVFND